MAGREPGQRKDGGDRRAKLDDVYRLMGVPGESDESMKMTVVARSGGEYGVAGPAVARTL
jgi:hypothetical protein